MLFIIVAVIVGLELIVMTVGTAIPESRITATPILVNELRLKVSIFRIDLYIYTLYMCMKQFFCYHTFNRVDEREGFNMVLFT